MDWFKVFSDGILRGSMANADDELQLIWIKFMALESETHYRDGCLRFCKGQPYSLSYIAENCRKPVSSIEYAIKAFENDINEKTGEPRISYDEDGSIRLNKWSFFQNYGGKQQARQKAIESNIQNKKRREAATDQAIKAVHDIQDNVKTIKKRTKFIARGKNKIINTETGEIGEFKAIETAHELLDNQEKEFDSIPIVKEIAKRKGKVIE